MPPRIADWGSIVERLPPLDRAYQIDFRLLSDRLADLPDEVNGVLRLFDGRRTLAEMLEEADHEGLRAAEALVRLWSERIIRPAPAAPRAVREGEGHGAIAPLAAEEWFRGPTEAHPASTPSSDGGMIPPSLPAAPARETSSAPRIVRFPAKRKARPPALMGSTSCSASLAAATKLGRPISRRASYRRVTSTLVWRGRRPLAAAVLLAAILAGLGIWRVVAG
jgi:hypothetical protein